MKETIIAIWVGGANPFKWSIATADKYKRPEYPLVKKITAGKIVGSQEWFELEMVSYDNYQYKKYINAKLVEGIDVAVRE